MQERGIPRQGYEVFVDSKKKDILYIPEGFAHGFLSMSENSIVCYKTSREYSKAHDSGILWNDKRLNIEWPCVNPKLSDKDKNHLTFDEYVESQLKK